MIEAKRPEWPPGAVAVLVLPGGRELRLVDAYTGDDGELTLDDLSVVLDALRALPGSALMAVKSPGGKGYRLQVQEGGSPRDEPEDPLG